MRCKHPPLEPAARIVDLAVPPKQISDGGQDVGVCGVLLERVCALGFLGRPGGHLDGLRQQHTRCGAFLQGDDSKQHSR
eukprot:1157152-Pelagomonas_calceolata.AAC.6